MEKLKLFSLAGLIVYFIILLTVVFLTRKNKNIEDYFFAGRSLPFWALSITFIASWWGAGAAISTADLAYEDGLSSFWYYGVPAMISTALLMLFSKAIRRVGCYTQGLMFAKRYNRTAALLLSIMIFWFMTITAATQIVGVGQFLSMYLGISYNAAAVGGTAVVLIYSLFGGFRGVVITDVIQFIFLLASAIIVFAVALYTAGGFSAISEAAAKASKPEFTSFFHRTGDYIVYVITFSAAWMIQAGIWQRISATRNENDAKRMTMLSLGAYLPLNLIVVITGMAGLAIYKEMPSHGIVPALVNDYMHPVLGAFIFIGICSAIMSTMDSLINTGALTLSMDIYSGYINPAAGKRRLMLVSQFSTVLVTFLAVLIAIRNQSFLEVSWLAADFITTGAFVPLIAGFLWRRGNAAGTIASMLAGIAFCFYNLLQTFELGLPVIVEPGSTGAALSGIFISAIVYITVSLLTKPEFQKAETFIARAGLISPARLEGSFIETTD